LGEHLVFPDAHPSVAGDGPPSGIDKAAGSALDGLRTYIYDQGPGDDLVSGVATRGDAADFAMLIWDMGSAVRSVRIFPHQDHLSGPADTPFEIQDVMEWSVWGSHDGDSFVLLSDVIGFDAEGGGGPGLPTYTFAGTEPTVIYRGGSTEFGALNAYTRDYVFDTAFRYYGVRTSSLSLDFEDADPEIDAVAALPEPTTLLLLGAGTVAVGLARRRKKS
jgi:hypothetical protein